jgi:hypothetical protein
MALSVPPLEVSEGQSAEHRKVSTMPIASLLESLRPQGLTEEDAVGALGGHHGAD